MRQNQKARRGDWFTIGDLARIDDEGYLYIVDLKIDMIITGGENVYPREVEEVLLAHPAVGECAVAGAPNAYWGKAITAFVMQRNGMHTDPAQFESLRREKLARYRVPKDIRMVAGLPRYSMGKILRRQLRDELAAR